MEFEQTIQNDISYRMAEGTDEEGFVDTELQEEYN